MHNKIVDFGKHRGELWTRIPLNYLRWCVNEGAHEEEAKAELERRGSSQLPKIELSNHAVDRASLRLRKLWYTDTDKQIGLWTWLHDFCLKALEEGYLKDEDEKGKVIMYRKVKLKFSKGNFYPTLMTVINKNR